MLSLMEPALANVKPKKLRSSSPRTMARGSALAERYASGMSVRTIRADATKPRIGVSAASCGSESA